MALKRKRRKKKRDIAPGSLKLAILFIGSIIVAGILIYLLYHPSSRVSSAVYEETPSGYSDLNAEISRIDHAIYESLYNGRVEEKDIFFSGVSAGNKKDNDWEFTEISIRVPDRKNAFHLGTVIQKELSKLKPDVEIKSESISDCEIVYSIFSLAHFTHRIKLICKSGWEQPPGKLPKIAIVIDDIGNDYALAISFMEIKLPITFSILPSSPYAKDIAEKAREKGFEIILHLPMEPKNYPGINPGPDALLIKMDENEVRAIIDEDLKKVPGVSGVNNHMGSYFTEREDEMTYVLRELKRRNLFFLDSRTTSNSIGFTLAQSMGIPSAKKSVFLDNDLSSKALKYQIERLIGTARYSGEAIGIGHPHKATLDALRAYEGVLKKDFKVVPVSSLMK